MSSTASANESSSVQERAEHPYLVGLPRQELLVPWCASCDRPHFPPRSFCPHCWGDEIDWRPASGKGSIYSFTVVRANPPSEFQADLPFTIAIVQLTEGVRLLTHISGSPEDVRCDLPVRVSFLTRKNNVLPIFEIVDTTDPE